MVVTLVGDCDAAWVAREAPTSLGVDLRQAHDSGIGAGPQNHVRSLRGQSAQQGARTLVRAMFAPHAVDERELRGGRSALQARTQALDIGRIEMQAVGTQRLVERRSLQRPQIESGSALRAHHAPDPRTRSKSTSTLRSWCSRLKTRSIVSRPSASTISGVSRATSRRWRLCSHAVRLAACTSR